MPTYQLPYGRGTCTFSLDVDADVELILPTHTAACQDPQSSINQALQAPIGIDSLGAFRGARSAAIAINDKTRPVPHALLLPPLLEAIEDLGIAREAITLIIATGTHIPMAPETFAKVVPAEILSRYRVISHDCDAPDLVPLGTTSAGTPVAINHDFMAADLRVVVGNVEPHHFAGFSGGVKSAAIGCAGRATIAANHSLLVDPNAALAVYEANPLRQDIEEIGELTDTHLALNVVMNDDKEIVGAFSGRPRSVIGAAMPVVRSIYEVPVAEPYDVMITCPGGYPKDINLYQAHKAVSCANRVTRQGGEIVLVAACEDGIGSAGYARFMARGFASHEAVMAQFVQEPFEIGPHKAFIFARDAVRAGTIHIVSEIPDTEIEQLLLHPATLEEAIAGALTTAKAAQKERTRPLRIGIMPYANATIPTLKV